MPKMTIKEAIANQAKARNRYAAAVREFRESYAELGALDQMLTNYGIDSRHFGIPPDVTLLRHAIAVPEERGSIESDIMAIVHSTTIERG
jgi:hypothetical protein